MSTPKEDKREWWVTVVRNFRKISDGKVASAYNSLKRAEEICEKYGYDANHPDGTREIVRVVPASEVTRLELELERVNLQLWQAKGALGYPVPGHIPQGTEFNCGLCEAKVRQLDYSKSKLSEAQAGRDEAVVYIDELLSYMPKVPTQPYERELAQKLAETEESLKLAYDIIKSVKLTSSDGSEKWEWCSEMLMALDAKHPALFEDKK